MKRFPLILSFFSALFYVINVGAQTALTDYRPGITNDGAVYFLPKTAIRVSVLVEKSVYEPGEFSKYANRYLRMSDVAQEPSTSYRMVSIRQTPIALPDTTKGFSVKFNAKTVAANVALSEDGRLLAINAQPKEVEVPVEFVAAPKPEKINPRKYMNQEILAAGSTAKMAELTAREIYDLRENRNLLIKGQADFMPSDGAQMKLMLSQLEAQDQALTQLFAGTTVRDTTETILTVIPDGPLQKQVLFRLSQKLGFVDADDLSGAPFYISIDDLNTIPKPVEDQAKGNKKKQPETGIYVNIPGRMRSTISYNGKSLHTMELPAPQFGNVELLSAELFNKHYTTHLWLNPLTGAVDKLEAEQPK